MHTSSSRSLQIRDKGQGVRLCQLSVREADVPAQACMCRCQRGAHGAQHRPVAVLQTCRHRGSRVGRTTSEPALHQAGCFFSADTNNYRTRPGHPQDTLLLTDNTEIIFDKCYTPIKSTELASWGAVPGTLIAS